MLTVDIGETTGWTVWDDAGDPIESGQTPLWRFIDAVYDTYLDPTRLPMMRAGTIPAQDVELRSLLRDVKPQRWVIEDFRIYPWKCKDLAWDGVHTARGLGALQLIARVTGVDYLLQPAKIKDTAQSAGAEAYYYEPVHENRHANDSLQHGVFYKVSVDHPILQSLQTRPGPDGLD